MSDPQDASRRSRRERAAAAERVLRAVDPEAYGPERDPGGVFDGAEAVEPEACEAASRERPE